MFDENSKLYKPFNDYICIMYYKLNRKLGRKLYFLNIVKLGKKYVELFLGKPKIRRTIEIDGKNVAVSVFYDMGFVLNKTKINIFGFNGTTKEYFKKLYGDALKNLEWDEIKSNLNAILAKPDKEILQEFAHMIMDNLLAVLQNNSHLIKRRMSILMCDWVIFPLRKQDFNNQYLVLTIFN